jgi:hypothetical protein
MVFRRSQIRATDFRVVLYQWLSSIHPLSAYYATQAFYLTWRNEFPRRVPAHALTQHLPLLPDGHALAMLLPKLLC